MARKTSHLQSKRLADPSTFVLLDGAMAEAKARYERQLGALFAEMAPLVEAQRTGALSSADEAQLMTLKAQFVAVSIEQKLLAEAALEPRLNDREDGKQADA